MSCGRTNDNLGGSRRFDERPISRWRRLWIIAADHHRPPSPHSLWDAACEPFRLIASPSVSSITLLAPSVLAAHGHHIAAVSPKEYLGALI